MAASRITKSTVFSQSWQNVYDIVNDRSKVSDPLGTSVERRKFVYSREPDVKAAGFGGYPFIIVHPSSAKQGEKKRLSRKTGPVDWAIEIEIVTGDRGNNQNEGKGLEYMDAISDDIFETFSSATNLVTLHANNLANVRLDFSDVTAGEEHASIVYRRSGFLTATMHLRLSS